MKDTKKWSSSSGVWGGLIAAAMSILAMILTFFGFDIDTETTEMMKALAVEALALAGSVTAIVGRIRASKRITRNGANHEPRKPSPTYSGSGRKS